MGIKNKVSISGIHLIVSTVRTSSQPSSLGVPKHPPPTSNSVNSLSTAYPQLIHSLPRSSCFAPFLQVCQFASFVPVLQVLRVLLVLSVVPFMLLPDMGVILRVFGTSVLGGLVRSVWSVGLTDLELRVISFTQSARLRDHKKYFSSSLRFLAEKSRLRIPGCRFLTWDFWLPAAD